MTENRQNNSKGHKKTSKKIIEIPAGWVAEAVKCSESTVRSSRNGTRGNTGKVGQSIEIAELLLEEGVNQLIEAVKKVVKI